MARAYVRRQVRATKPIFRRVYRSPKPLRRDLPLTVTAAATGFAHSFAMII